MAKTNTWMPFYVADYYRDTEHLTTEQHGAYFLLIMAAWSRGGSLPNDARQLASICRMTKFSWQKSENILRTFFEISDGFWTHRRVVRELERSKSLSEIRAKVAADAAEKRKSGAAKAPAIAEQKPTHARVAIPSPLQIHPPTVEEGSVSKDTAQSAFLDPDAKAWSDGRELLIQRASMTKDAAGKFIGKLIQEHGLQARQLLPAINSAIANGTQAPKDYLVQSAARISNKKPRPVQQAPGEPVDLEWC